MGITVMSMDMSMEVSENSKGFSFPFCRCGSFCSNWSCFLLYFRSQCLFSRFSVLFLFCLTSLPFSSPNYSQLFCVPLLVSVFFLALYHLLPWPWLVSKNLFF